MEQFVKKDGHKEKCCADAGQWQHQDKVDEDVVSDAEPFEAATALVVTKTPSHTIVNFGTGPDEQGDWRENELSCQGQNPAARTLHCVVKPIAPEECICVEMIIVLFRDILATNPAKYVSTTRTGHMVAPARFVDDDSTFGALGHAIVHPRYQKFSIARNFALLFVIGVSALGARILFAPSTQGFPIATTARFCDEVVAVGRRTPLQFLVLANLHILVYRFVYFDDFVAAKRLNLLNFEHLFALSLHAGQFKGVPHVTNTNLQVLGCAIHAKFMLASQPEKVFLFVAQIAYFANPCINDTFHVFVKEWLSIFIHHFFIEAIYELLNFFLITVFFLPAQLVIYVYYVFLKVI